MTDFVHEGLEAFNAGRFDDGGSNLYVNARGEIERIHRTDLDGDGWPDIVVPNTHGHLERGPTRIFKAQGGAGVDAAWTFTDLPNDSGWRSRIADVDGDGFPDVVVCNGENGVTSELPSYVYWGGPSGLTGERTELPTVGAYDVLAADVSGHGDGRLDLLMPSAWTDHHNPGSQRPIHAWVQVAPRVFEDRGPSSGVTSVAGLAIDGGSLRGDGALDVAIANLYADYTLDTDSFVWLGRAGGGWEAEPVRLPSRAASAVRMADLDGDGRPEVILAGGDTVFVYWNREGVVVRDVVTRLDVPGFATQFQRRDVGLAVADVDGDGRNELLLATRAGIEIRRGDALDHVALLLPVEYAIRVEAADVDGDGRPDLLVSVYMDEATHDVASRIYWNGPNGFTAERWTALPAAGVIGMTAGDLDGDGRAEVVLNVTMQGPTSTWSGFPAYIYPGGPSRAFDPDRRLEIPSAGEVYAYAVADLDLDGCPDLVLARVFGLRIFRGGPSGIRPDDWYELSLDDPAAVCMQVHVADLNRDGWLDLVAVVQTYDDRPETRAKSTRIFWGGPDGYSLERQSVVETYSTGGAVLADVDDDGYLDLVVAEKSASLAIHHGGPGAVWPSGRVSQVPLATRGHPSTVAVADIDADGYLDLIVDVAGHYARSPESFLVLWGGTDGFSAHRALRHDGGYTPGQLSVADVDGDGHLELLVPAYSAAASRRLPWEIHRFDGRSLAGEPQRFPGLGSCHVLPIDLDGDGRIDLIVSNHRDDDVHTAPTEIYWNGPAGISRDAVTRLPAMGPHYLTIRDPYNARDRSPVERYTSPALHVSGRVTGIDWDADVPDGTSLAFEVRSSNSETALEHEPWLDLGDTPSVLSLPVATAVVQYRASFVSATAARSPRLRSVRIGLA
jgi:hypothetical protein